MGYVSFEEGISGQIRSQLPNDLKVGSFFGIGKWDPEIFKEIQVGEIFFFRIHSVILLDVGIPFKIWVKQMLAESLCFTCTHG